MSRTTERQTANSLKNNLFGFSDPALDVLNYYDGNVRAHPDDVRREGGRPIVHTDVVAAGDTLSKSPVVRDAFGAKAIETEAADLWDAADHAKKEFVVVRGMVDYCDAFKADAYRAKALASAPAVLRLLFETLKNAQIEGRSR